MTNSLNRTLIMAVLALGAGSAVAQETQDAEMLQLAATSGCLTCHSVEPGKTGPNGIAPVGPAWKEVAAKYQGQADAEAKLTETVLKGSNPYESHWKGKVSGLAMPPNAVAISEENADKLVQWILSLAE